MRVLVLGGSGNVGKLVVQQLLARGHEVHVIVRMPENMPSTLVSEPKLSLIKANLLDLSVNDVSAYMKGSDAVVCTLGHNLNYGRVPVLGKLQLGFAEATKRFSMAPSLPPPPLPFPSLPLSNRHMVEPSRFGRPCHSNGLRIDQQARTS